MFWSQLNQPPALLITAMVYGGVFARHPRLRLLIAEFGIARIPWFLDKLDLGVKIEPVKTMVGPWSDERTPSHVAADHVIITPLPRSGLDEAQYLIPPAQLDGDTATGSWAAARSMLAFSSDTPHVEGAADAVDRWHNAFATLGLHTDNTFVSEFFGARMAQVLAG